MRKRAGWMLIGVVIGWAGSAGAQKFRVSGGSEPAAEFRSSATTGGVVGGGEVLRAEVTHDEYESSAAVVGIAEPRPAWGYGGYFKGGNRGVQGEAKLPGAGGRIGVEGVGNNGNWNKGVYGSAVAPNESGKTAYGVTGTAACSSTPSLCTKYGVYASGDVAYTGDLLDLSDLRFKESLEPLDRALSKLLQLEVVSYEHIRTEEVRHMNLPEGPQVGFIGQQVATVLPELVTEAVHPPAGDPLVRSRDTKLIRYQALKPIELIPYLVRAVQEQQAEIDALKAQLLPLQNRLAELEPEAGVEEVQMSAAL